MAGGLPTAAAAACAAAAGMAAASVMSDSQVEELMGQLKDVVNNNTRYTTLCTYNTLNNTIVFDHNTAASGHLCLSEM